VKTIFALSAVLLLAGCGMLTNPVVTQVPVINPASTNGSVVTNIPPQTVSLAITNDVITYITNTPPPQVITHTVIQPASTNYLSVTNYVPNPTLLSALDTAKTVNQSVNVTPTSAPINMALTALAGLATLAAGYMTNKANKTGTALTTAQSVSSTIIGAIDKLAPEIANVVKPAVQAAGIKAGVADDIHAAVQAATT